MSTVPKYPKGIVEIEIDKWKSMHGYLVHTDFTEKAKCHLNFIALSEHAKDNIMNWKLKGLWLHHL